MATFTEISSLIQENSFSSSCIVKHGNYIYWGYNSASPSPGINIIDVSDPQNPTVVGNLPAPSTPYAVAVSDDGNTLYVILVSITAFIFSCDISDKTAPAVIGELDLTLPLASTNPGIQILQILNATTALVLVDTGEGESVQAVDITDPTAMTLTGTPTYAGEFMTGIYVENNRYLYIAEYVAEMVGTRTQFQIWDIVDINSPALLSTTAEIVGWPEAFVVKNSVLYGMVKDIDATNTHTLVLYDVSDRGNPGVLLSSTLTSIDVLKNVVVLDKSSTNVVTADGEFDSMFLFDVSDPTIPTQTATDSQGAYGLVYEDPYIYIAGDAISPATFFIYSLLPPLVEGWNYQSDHVIYNSGA